MSQASIPVYTDFILRTGQAQAEMKAFQGQVEQFTARLVRQTVDIPVRLDVGDASAQADEFTRGLTRDALRVPVAISDTLARAQFANLVEDLTSRPIVVPVQFAPAGGGLPGPGGVPAFAPPLAAGGGPILLPPGGGPTAPSLPPAAPAGLLLPGTTFTPTNAPAGLPAAPYAPPVPMAQVANVGVLPLAGGGPAATAAPGGFLDGAFSRRGLMGAMMAIHGMNSLVSELQKMGPGQFDSITNPRRQAEAYESTLREQSTGLRGFMNDRVYTPILNGQGYVMDQIGRAVPPGMLPSWWGGKAGRLQALTELATTTV